MSGKKIGIIFGMENTFPPALVGQESTLMGVDGVSAEFKGRRSPDGSAEEVRRHHRPHLAGHSVSTAHT